MARRDEPQGPPPTPRGLEEMARGNLEPFDPEMYGNLNTGVLEQYLDERNRQSAFRRGRWVAARVLLGLAVGTLFALVNVYVGLKVGLIVAGAWYLTWLVGASRGWSPGDVNLASGAGTAASLVIAGLVFTYPALVLLQLAQGHGFPPVLANTILPRISTLVVASALAGLLGALTFVLYRRLWLVEEPLRYPRFEAYLRLLELAGTLSDEAKQRVRYGLRAFLAATAGSAVFAVLRDAPLSSGRSVLGALLAWTGRFRDGTLGMTPGESEYTSLGITLSPLLVAVGWFLRLRTALAFAAGSAFTWLVVVPMAVAFDVGVVAPNQGAVVGLQSLWHGGVVTAPLAFQGPGVVVAAGALVGAGLVALLRAAPAVGEAARDLGNLPRRWVTSAYEAGRGWYEWPPQHLAVGLAVLLVGVPVLLVLDGFAPGPATLVTLVLALATLLLGAAVVKVLGHTSAEPLSGAAFVVFGAILLVAELLGVSPVDAVVLALTGTTIFGAAAALAGNVLLDFKNALYVGVRPLLQMRAETLGIIPGLVAGALAVTVLAPALATGRADLAAPQARTFATLAELAVGQRVPPALLLLGGLLGAFVELRSNAGVTFALGMFLPAGYAVPIVAGGVLRAWWEHRVLPGAGDEEARTVHLLDSYMVATGLIVGEALVGIALAAGWTLGWLG